MIHRDCFNYKKCYDVGMYTLEKARLGSIKFYEEVGDVGVICRRCRISRPTLRKLRHYEKDVLEGLKGLSCKPLCSQKRSQ